MNPAVPAPPSRRMQLLERVFPVLARLRRPDQLPVEFDRRRIYVLPTRFALALFVLILVMLVGALNYANNPALLLTCLFAAASWSSIFSGFRALSGLRVTGLQVGESHAGGHLEVTLELAASERTRHALRLQAGSARSVFSVPAGTAGPVILRLPAARRGWQALPRLRLWTTWPLGLFQCWGWLRPDLRALIYPQLETPPPPLPPAPGGLGEQPAAGEDHSLAGLRDYRPGDAPRMVAWKASARHQTLLVRDSERSGAPALLFDYHALHGLDHEQRISRLGAWVCAASAQQLAYALHLPGNRIGAAADDAHRRACLRALALLPRTDA